MKRLVKLMAMALALLPLLVGASASAQQATCDVGFTGPDSQNMCTSTTTYRCTVNNTNTVTITNDNNQTVASGTVTTSGNTTGGTSTSGTVTNSNGTTFSVTITNPVPDTDNGTCVAKVTVPATTPVTPVTPASTGGGGGGAVVLPNTSTGSPLEMVAWVAGATALVAALSVGGVIAYRHFKA